jgi:hypothetical protein
MSHVVLDRSPMLRNDRCVVREYLLAMDAERCSRWLTGDRRILDRHKGRGRRYGFGKAAGSQAGSQVRLYNLSFNFFF